MIIVIVDDKLSGVYPYETALKALIVDTYKDINNVNMKIYSNFNGLMYDNKGCKIAREMYYHLCNMLGENPICNLRILFNEFKKNH